MQNAEAEANSYKSHQRKREKVFSLEKKFPMHGESLSNNILNITTITLNKKIKNLEHKKESTKP